jgi:hypothetical protein
MACSTSTVQVFPCKRHDGSGGRAIHANLEAPYAGIEPAWCCAWLVVEAEAWLPRRLSRRGALAALVGVAEPLDSQSVRTLEYLQASVRKAQLDFIPLQRERPATSVVSSIDLITEPAGAAAQSLQELYGHRDHACRHWGLNE